MKLLNISIVLLVTIVLSSDAIAMTFIQISLSSQTMHVKSSRGHFVWPVSTARPGYRTPRGTFSPKSMKRMHYSSKYDNSPMPHSIFFSGGYAIHGSYAISTLGQPVSHGCVRLSPSHAAQLYDMVRREGGHITIY